MNFQGFGHCQRFGDSDQDHCTFARTTEKTSNVGCFAASDSAPKRFARYKWHSDHPERLSTRRRINHEHIPARLVFWAALNLMINFAHHGEFAESRRGINEI